VGNWYLGSGGLGGAGRVPLAHDNVIADASSFSSTSTVTFDCRQMGTDIDFSAVDEDVTLDFDVFTGTDVFVMGDYRMNINTTHAYHAQYTLTLCTVETDGEFYPGTGNYSSVKIYGRKGTETQAITLLSDVICDRIWFMTYGDYFDFNDYDLTASSITFLQTGTRDIDYGSGTMTATGIVGTTMTSGSSGIHNFETSTLKMAPASSSFDVAFKYAGTRAFYNIEIAGGSTGFTSIWQNINSIPNGADITCHEFKINKGRKVKIFSGETWNVEGFVANGDAGNGITLQSTSSAYHYWVKTTPGDVYTYYMTIDYSDATGYFDLESINRVNFDNNVGYANKVPEANVASFNRVGIRYFWYAENSTGTNYEGWKITL